MGEDRNPPQQSDSIVSQPVEELKSTVSEPPQAVEQQVSLKSDKKIEPKPMEKEPIKDSKGKTVQDEIINNKEITISDDEESLTPPLLPSMKVINKDTLDSKEVEKKNEKDKNKKSEWDMFAEQDIFKNSTNVSIRCLCKYF